jgi:four helix bundle protein
MPLTYNQLDAWKRAIDLACEVYRISKLLPRDERFGLQSQIRRAVVSISLNIAEGSGRHGSRELLHRLSLARGSLKEVETLLHLMERLDYTGPEQLQVAWELCGHVSRLLYGMRRRYAT